MPIHPTYPGIYIEELPPTTRTIAAAPTSIAVFIGHTHPFKTKGSWGKPVAVFSFTDYEREFGGLYRHEKLDSHVPYAVQQFFLNGGSMAYVVPIEPRYWTSGPPPTSSPFLPAQVKIGGDPPTLTFTAKEPTDSVRIMRVRFSNFRKSDPGLMSPDIADITFTYSSRAEVFRGVQIGQIETRLASSELASVELQGATSYSTATVEWAFAVDPAPPDSATVFHPGDYTTVFTESSPLDKVDAFNLLLIPGIAGNQAAVWSQALAFCERKHAFAILDSTLTGPADSPTHALSEMDVVPKSANGAFYFPHLTTVDALTGDPISLPPSGYVAGIFARTDTNRGVWKAPAGLETVLQNASGVVENGRLTDGLAGLLNGAGVNALRTFPGVGTVVFGARTLVTQNNAFAHWRYVSVRRMALFIEQTLLRNLGWVVFEPNDEPLWVAIRSSIEAFMLSLFRQGAFQGATPSQAFLVKCDSSTTTQTDIDEGKVNIVVGFRPLKPAEFVIIKIAQLAGQTA